MTGKFEYTVEDDGDVYPEDAVVFENPYAGRDVDWVVADAAAAHYGSEVDSDCTWPLIFAIYRDGELQGRFSVDRDYSPEYISVTLPTFPRTPPSIETQWRAYFKTVATMNRIRKANPTMTDEADRELAEQYRQFAKARLLRLVFP